MPLSMAMLEPSKNVELSRFQCSMVQSEKMKFPFLRKQINFYCTKLVLGKRPLAEASENKGAPTGPSELLERAIKTAMFQC